MKERSWYFEAASGIAVFMLVVANKSAGVENVFAQRIGDAVRDSGRASETRKTPKPTATECKPTKEATATKPPLPTETPIPPTETPPPPNTPTPETTVVPTSTPKKEEHPHNTPTSPPAMMPPPSGADTSENDFPWGPAATGAAGAVLVAVGAGLQMRKKNG